MNGVSFLLIGALRKYKPLHGWNVARAMIIVSKNNIKGIHRYGYNEIKNLSQ